MTLTDVLFDSDFVFFLTKETNRTSKEIEGQATKKSNLSVNKF